MSSLEEDRAVPLMYIDLDLHHCITRIEGFIMISVGIVCIFLKLLGPYLKKNLSAINHFHNNVLFDPKGSLKAKPHM